MGYKALYVENGNKNISFVGLPNCTNVPSKHVLLKSYEFFDQMYIKSTPQILQAIMRKTVDKTMQQRF